MDAFDDYAQDPLSGTESSSPRLKATNAHTGLTPNTLVEMFLDSWRAARDDFARTMYNNAGHRYGGTADESLLYLYTRQTLEPRPHDDLVVSGYSYVVHLCVVDTTATTGRQELSFPLLSVPQAVVNRLVSWSAHEHKLSEYVENRALGDVRAQHAFLVHVCDLLMRPLGLVGRTSVDVYRSGLDDIEELVYTVTISDSSYRDRVIALVEALLKGMKGTTPRSSSPTTPQTRPSPPIPSPRSVARKLVISAYDRCPITYRKSRFIHVYHGVPERIGQHLYEFLMEALWTEHEQTGRYGELYRPLTWDINGPQNLILMSDQTNGVPETYTLLPMFVPHPSDQALPPSICRFRSVWKEDQDMVGVLGLSKPLLQSYIFFNFEHDVWLHDELLQAYNVVQVFERVDFVDLTSTSAYFVKTLPPKDEHNKADHKLYPYRAPHSPSPSANIPLSAPGPEFVFNTPAGPYKFVRGAVQGNCHPVLLNKPPGTFWPIGERYPSPLAWDAATPARFIARFPSFAVRCFTSVLNSNALPDIIRVLEAVVDSPPGCRDESGELGPEGSVNGPPPGPADNADSEDDSGQCNSTSGAGHSMGDLLMLALMIQVAIYAEYDSIIECPLPQQSDVRPVDMDSAPVQTPNRDDPKVAHYLDNLNVA